MPEIKNTFTQGKMNKDLDERIVPNGQYRDALNIQVSTSEGADVGTVQNILGNTLVNPGQFTSMGSDFECIGSIADERNDTLYYFITDVENNSVDAIIQYKSINFEQAGAATPVLVDTKAGTSDAVLKFSDIVKTVNGSSTQGLITAINIIDDILLWTDGVNEPRKINITNCIAGSTSSLADHTQLNINGANLVDIAEEHITVIKKNPLRPLSVKINPADPSNKKPLFEKIFPRFSYRYRYEDGEYSTFAPFTDVVFKSLYGTRNFHQAGIVYDNNNAYGIDEPYNSGMRNMINSVELSDFVSPGIPKDVIQVDLLYKQENSSVIYILETIESDNTKWTANGFNSNSAYKGSFTVTSENIYAALPENQLLRPWDNIPKTALAQEVTGNRLVYGNYTQGYNLIDVDNNKVAPTTISEYGFRNIVENDFTNGGLPSVKSQRNYQIGIVYGDKYGRETPVFTNEDASLTIPWGGNLASQSLQLKTNIQNFHPEWASYYKFFVKETSGEYFNLAMSALYRPTKEDIVKDDHVWLAFASSDRNKISEEDYIILKRKIGEAQVDEENKYKILDIKNEAPDAVKYKYLKLGEVDNSEAVPGAGGRLNATVANGGIFYDTNFRPAFDKDMFYIHKTNWQNADNNGMSLTENDETTKADDLYVSWTNTQGTTPEATRRYKVASIRISNNNVYIIQLEKPISSEDGLLITQPGTTTAALHDDAVFKVEKKIVKNMEAFSGKFFVKIHGLGIVTELQDANELQNIYTTTNSQNIHWHADVSTTTFDPDDGLINNGSYIVGNLDAADQTKTVAGINSKLTNTEVGWDNILTEVKDTTDATSTVNQFFIDNMYMAASQPSVDSVYGGFARHSGQGWYGGNPIPVGDIIYADSDGDWDGSSSLPTGYSEAFDAGTSPPHTDGIAWPTNSDITLQTPTTTTSGDNMVNGIPGVIQLGDDHNSATGIRRWKKSIHNTDLTMWDYGNHPAHDGKNVIHLSFLAPGEDLHDGSLSGDTSWDGLNFINLPTKLQGIWGGGVFTKDDGSDFTNNIHGGSSYKRGVVCEREFGYTWDGSSNQGYASAEWVVDPDIDEPLVITSANTKRRVGYHPSYETRHRNQWKPWKSGGTYNATIHAFVQALKTPGQKFRFKGDDTEAVYTIQRVVEKRIYNHTPWRRMYKHSSSGLVATGDSVEEAAIAWRETASSSNQSGDTIERDAFKTAVENFGKANNRRVCYIIHLEDNVFPISGAVDEGNPTQTDTNSKFNSLDANLIEFIDEDFNLLDGKISEHPAIWETEPKDNVDLDIYYEAGQAYPMILTEENRELFAPIGCKVTFLTNPLNTSTGSTEVIDGTVENYLDSWNDIGGVNNIMTLSTGFPGEDANGISLDYSDVKVKFTREDGSYTPGKIIEGTIAFFTSGGTRMQFKIMVDRTGEHGLSWYNCFSFGNGVESNRIRDDFNAMTITNGVRANATIDRPYVEEHRKSGLIYSGIYNSKNGVNNLNQFIMAEKITKDLNPTFGSIQKLFSRRISLIAFCEDRVVGITANKNALYNADGNPQLVATNAVLGDANPFVGDYGISQNPESFAKESYRAYFTDRQRGAVLRLSIDGLTPISEAGMSDWFKDEFKDTGHYNIIGSYDNYKKNYNLTFDRGGKTYGEQGNEGGLSQTVSFSEDVKGWTSFKSFIPESGVSMSGDYYTFYNGKCWKHHTDGNRNSFYGGSVRPSTIKFLLNESPLAIKNYNTLNYDGDESWICSSIETDQQEGSVQSFIEKEGKWFNYISGDEVVDTQAFNFQGIGIANEINYNI